MLGAALAWRLQERKFGGLKPAIRRKLRVLARAYKREGTPTALVHLSSTLRPGTVLQRQWRGASHMVMVLVDAFNVDAFNMVTARPVGMSSMLAKVALVARKRSPDEAMEPV